MASPPPSSPPRCLSTPPRAQRMRHRAGTPAEQRWKRDCREGDEAEQEQVGERDRRLLPGVGTREPSTPAHAVLAGEGSLLQFIPGPSFFYLEGSRGYLELKPNSGSEGAANSVRTHCREQLPTVQDGSFWPSVFPST
ncbi:hypothetical protein SVAN01_09534 [Stagonosporopsis vannaccii]|nr:hypothetical protein SVAN01_09534 [Stagonosporopsis vannaccii]